MKNKLSFIIVVGFLIITGVFSGASKLNTDSLLLANKIDSLRFKNDFAYRDSAFAAQLPPKVAGLYNDIIPLFKNLITAKDSKTIQQLQKLFYKQSNQQQPIKLWYAGKSKTAMTLGAGLEILQGYPRENIQGIKIRQLQLAYLTKDGKYQVISPPAIKDNKIQTFEKQLNRLLTENEHFYIHYIEIEPEYD